VRGNSHSHGARPVHPIITMIKWIRTSRLTISSNRVSRRVDLGGEVRGREESGNNHSTETCSGSEAGLYLRPIDSGITQFKAQGPSRTCNESKEEEIMG